MKTRTRTRTLTRYRLRWRTTELPPGGWALRFGYSMLAIVVPVEGGKYRTTMMPGPDISVGEVAYEGPSLPQAKRTASEAIRRFMCREVDGQQVLGQRVRRGRVRR